MKKIIIILSILFVTTPAFSFDFFNSSQIEIKSVLRKYNKALATHNIEKIKTFYAKNYKSMDGFNLGELEQMLEKTYSAYENIKYKTKINSINATSDWALVQMSDKTTAKIFPTEIKELKKEKMGKLEGKSVYNLYLKKENNEWKIVCDDILMEETSLKYGLANKLNMELITPIRVQSGSEYDLSLKIDKPKDIMALASISREEIVYPPEDYQEKFRKIPEAGELERVVKANNKNLDEYAVASIGLTKVSINEEQTKAKIEVLGMAYLMKRVNMDRTRKNGEMLVENK
ncbi:MAG: hypothetical protein IKU37_10065 [Candidatus Gastranaerophilales bacterium]|nr:hypothetical protein [Candidatus Gastranaerophilales bacterium]